MISRNTFSEILNGLKEYYDARITVGNPDAMYSFGCGNLVDAEDAILTLLSEGVYDCDGIIHDWLHGMYYTAEDGATYFKLPLNGGYSHQFRVADAGDLYDYLILLNDSEKREGKEINACRMALLRRYRLRDAEEGEKE